MIDLFFLQVIDTLRVCNRQPIAGSLLKLDKFYNIDSIIDIILIKDTFIFHIYLLTYFACVAEMVYHRFGWRCNQC